MHLQLVSAFTTAAGTSGTAAAAVTGDSLVVGNGVGDVRIIAAWMDCQATGWFQIATASGHDTTRGFRARVTASEARNRIPLGLGLPVWPQETMAVTIMGSATAGDVEHVCMLLKYQNLPGVDARLLTWAELGKRFEKLTTIEATLAGAAAGYTGEELINAESDLLLANRDYAVLGAAASVEAPALTMRGPDLGNVRVGVPGNDLDSDFGATFFATLARAYNEPMIPVISSGNKGATYIGTLQDENNANVTVSWYLALLRR